MKKTKEEIVKELNSIIGIVCEGLGSQYKCFIDIKANINIYFHDENKEPTLKTEITGDNIQ